MAITCDIELNGLAAEGLYVRFISLEVTRDAQNRHSAQWVAAYRRVVAKPVTDELLSSEYLALKMAPKPSFEAYKVSRLGSVPLSDEWHPFAHGRTAITSYESAATECYADLSTDPRVSNVEAVFEDGQADTS